MLVCVVKCTKTLILIQVLYLVYRISGLLLLSNSIILVDMGSYCMFEYGELLAKPLYDIMYYSGISKAVYGSAAVL